MSLKLFFCRYPVWSLWFWMLGATLWTVAGPALGQEGFGSPFLPTIAARAAVLMNPTTGEVLFAKEPHLRLPPASTTKVLTALVVLERLDPNSRVLVSPQAASAPPSRIGLHTGEAALTQDLLYGLLLKSGNDAAETLAEAAGGSVYGFADLMNTKAWQIGARDSHFMNPHGLPNDDHYSTAYDLALIFSHAISHPMFADIVGTRSAALRIESGQGVYGDSRLVPVQNHNRLLASYEGARGGKTGFTLKARRCFVGEVDRGGVRLIVAILNSPNSATLWQDARTLLDYGFARYGLAPPPPVQPEPEPVMVRHTPVATPTAVRVAMIRPAITLDRVEQTAAKTPIMSARPVSSRTKMVAVAKPAGKAAKSTVAVAKPAGKAAKSTVAVAKPAGKAAKSGAVVAIKSDQKSGTKLASARSEQIVPKPPQKNAKRRS